MQTITIGVQGGGLVKKRAWEDYEKFGWMYIGKVELLRMDEGCTGKFG